MIVWVVTNRLVIGWIFSLFWGVCHRSYPSLLLWRLSATSEVHCHLVTTKSDNMSCHCQHAIGRRLHVSRKVVWLDATHVVSSNKHSSLAIWSPTALPSPSEVCDYIGRSLPFFSVKQKEMSGLQEAFWHFVPSGRWETIMSRCSSSLNDGTKHGGMATLSSQLHLLMISAFTTIEWLSWCTAYARESTNVPGQYDGGS